MSVRQEGDVAAGLRLQLVTIRRADGRMEWKQRSVWKDQKDTISGDGTGKEMVTMTRERHGYAVPTVGGGYGLLWVWVWVAF